MAITLVHVFFYVVGFVLFFFMIKKIDQKHLGKERFISFLGYSPSSREVTGGPQGRSLK